MNFLIASKMSEYGWLFAVFGLWYGKKSLEERKDWRLKRWSKRQKGIE
jgi:hypothetical protein